MNMFSSGKQGPGQPGSKKPTIRREAVRVPVQKKAGPTPPSASASASARPSTPGNRFQLSARPSTKLTTTAAVAPPKAVKKKPPLPAQRAVAASRGLKRKSATPDRVLFSDDESDDEGNSSELGTSDSDASRKRIKSSVSSLESVGGARRDLVYTDAFDRTTDTLEILHGADATSGEFAAKFKAAWNEQDVAVVELQYPTHVLARERFELKWPKNEKDDYRPFEDIIETIKHVCLFYLPDDLQRHYTDEETGFERRIRRMWKTESIPDFLAIIADYNALLSSAVRAGQTRKSLSQLPGAPLPADLVQRILDQIYARTVSPKVESLRAYQNGSDNVYGELKYRFCRAIFAQTRLRADQVFVDLGSGVANIVLQAALEIGCPSWGIEMMKNPCDLADQQAKEFVPRTTKLWGIKPGTVKLLRGDFTQNQAIADVLKKADVVLVNNQAFTPALNDTLRDMFLDLKQGCQVVSLKPFVPEGHKITMRNVDFVANLFVQRRLEYFSDSVSWTDQPGNYYVAVKDSAPLERFRRAHGLG